MSGFLLAAPLFVVIIITPLAPAEPYNAVAAAPFKTFMVSTVDGSISMRRLLPGPELTVPVSELSIGIPSNTIKASLFP